MTKYIPASGLRKRSLQIFAAATFMLMAPLLITNHTRAAAQDNDKSSPRDKVAVIAQLPLPGSPVRQILMQEENGKEYLYLQQNVHFTVVDVTDPKNPRIVDRLESHGKLTDVGAGLAISVQSDQSGDAVPTQTVRLVDLKDPKNPRTVKTLTGVTSVYSDNGRKLIFAANNQGLWIIKHYESFRLPYCTSDSEANTVAQCQ
jgi:hypothetical protein